MVITMIVIIKHVVYPFRLDRPSVILAASKDHACIPVSIVYILVAMGQSIYMSMQKKGNMN